MLVGLRQQVGRSHVEKETAVDREQLAESVVRDRDEDTYDRPEQGREAVRGQPANRLAALAALAEDEVDRVHPVRKVVRDHREEDEQPSGSAEMEGQSDSEPVDEAVKRKPGGAERADLCVGLRLLGLVAVVQGDPPLRAE